MEMLNRLPSRLSAWRDPPSILAMVRFSQCFTFSRNSSSVWRSLDGGAIPVQRNVMAGNVFGAVFLGNKVVEQALMAGMGRVGSP